jgi:hypothetical protein
MSRPPTLSPKSRELLVSIFNKEILHAPNDDTRRILGNAFCSILIQVNSYNGFGHTDWLENGYERWVADGRPSDNSPYRGNESKITIY